MCNDDWNIRNSKIIEEMKIQIAWWSCRAIGWASRSDLSVVLYIFILLALQSIHFSSYFFKRGKNIYVRKAIWIPNYVGIQIPTVLVIRYCRSNVPLFDPKSAKIQSWQRSNVFRSNVARSFDVRSIRVQINIVHYSGDLLTVGIWIPNTGPFEYRTTVGIWITK